MFHLTIQRTSHGPVLLPGTRRLHAMAGTPAGLLEWLEVQLGLPRRAVSHVERVLAYREVLGQGALEHCARSFATDPWATAAELLTRRDELRMAGWGDGSAPGRDAGMPTVAAELARVEAACAGLPPGEAERLQMVAAALDAGQTLPPHRVTLSEPPDEWPPAWQPVLARLATEVSAQTPDAIPVPPALRWLRAASTTLACRTVATLLAADRAAAAHTVIVCEDDTVAIGLDECLLELGLPTMGTASRSAAQPVLQVLPLVMELAWEPVDPQLLLDFVMLPVAPLPARARGKLARALQRQPGFGSREWDAARAECESAENDPDGKVAARLARWLDLARYPREVGIPGAAVCERAGLVAQWATGRAGLVESDFPALATALHEAARQAMLLGELAGSDGVPLREAQLGRLLEAVAGTTTGRRVHGALDGAPRRVRSFAEIGAAVARVVWLGLGTRARVRSRWTDRDRALLARGTPAVIIDDGSRALRHQRHAERRGLARISEALLAVSLPGDVEAPAHPLWLELESHTGTHVDLERAIDAGADAIDETRAHLAPWAWAVETVVHVPARVRHVTWHVDPKLLRERERSSATALETRLACPLRWTLEYQARLRPGRSAQLPSGALLMGSFAHEVLAIVLGGGGALPATEHAIAEVARVFDERLPRDAAPLTRAAATGDRTRIRSQLLASTRVLLRTLHAGGYHVVGMEQKFDEAVDGRPLMGFIDCLVADDAGKEAVIDFKFGRSRHRRKLIQEGRATQLATYAAGRRASTGNTPRVAYLILANAALFTPASTAIAGTHRNQQVRGAPAIEEVWRQFRAAIEDAGDWFATGVLPVRPLADPETWPDGVALVLGPRDNPPEVCRYCEFGELCGRKEVR